MDTAYYPPSDAQGGWRTLTDPAEILRQTGIDTSGLDKALAVAAASSKNGGLLVVRHGWLVYERYFGRGHREATANLASCAKSFTSIAVGMLMAERPELFPEGLEQRVFTPTYLPPEAFPLSDSAKAAIKLGHLLNFTAGIRGSYGGEPASYVHGKPIEIDPPGPDGWQAMVDEIAFGKRDYARRDGRVLSARTLWCQPGEGYSYATSAIHVASAMLRHITGLELQEYLRTRLAEPLGWGRWGYGYRFAGLAHTPGGGGIVVRPTDMLRFGYLLLREGRWGDRQVVPAEYVRLCNRRSPYNPHFAYSLQFDVNTWGDYPELPRDAFWKNGAGVHALYVVPSLDLVVWKLGGRDRQYDPGDTGLPILPEAAAAEDLRADWREEVTEDAAIRRTLELVVRAIRPR
ncbi:MAG: serine hydrolase domain-containing protein [Anaerolineae bacterium]